MKISHLLLLAATAMFSFTSCDNIDEADRFEGPIENGGGDLTAQKNVLIEDFTGQKCVNCPLAHVETEKLQSVYGKERIISVALHGGPLAIDDTNVKANGLANTESKEYNNRHGSFSYPKGMIDRQGNLQDFEKWTGSVAARINLTPQVDIQLNHVTYDAATRTVSFQSELKSSASLTGNLQVWLTESNIVAYQKMPDGSSNKEYVHNHVFRAAVNGLDGDALALTPDQAVTKDYTYTLPEKYQAENAALVVFYYNADGVAQVVEAPVINL